MERLTMITRHGKSKDNIEAYTLITHDYQTVTLNKNDIIKVLKDNKKEVTNLALKGNEIVSTNGALDKYTFINSAVNHVEGTARAVILDRVEVNNKLVGYTVFTQDGQIREMNTADAAILANKGLISNGKVRHTQDGDIVSSINGNYPLRVITIENSPKGELKVKVMFFGASVSNDGASKYVGLMITGTSAALMSKMKSTLTDNNTKVKTSVAKISKNKDTSSLDMQRVGANGVYGVFTLDTLDELKKKADAVMINSFFISLIDYETENEDESVAILNNGSISMKEKGSAKGDKAVIAYAEEIKKNYI